MEYKLSSLQLAQLASWISARTSKTLDLGDCHDLATLTTIVTQNEEQKNNYVESNVVDCLLSSVKNGQKIEAIRMYRMLTGKGLKESKDIIEQYMS